MNPANAADAPARLSDRIGMFDWYRTMRRQAPVAPTQSGGWQVFGYDEVQRVLQDYATFSSERSDGDAEGPQNALGASIISLDPPRHHHLRSLVSKAFTPRAVDNLAPRIAALTDELLAPVLREGRMDVIGDLAYPLPVIVIAELLGIPPADRDRFKHWSDVIVGSAGSIGFGTAERELGQYFLGVIERRRREPREDLISALLRAEVDGEHLSMIELLGFCVLLLVAGNETTTNLIGNAIWCFTREPGLTERLAATPALLPAAIEEVLRYLSPVQMLPTRVAKTDVELGGKLVKAGQWLNVGIGSANRDEAKFPDADRFVPDRAPNSHLAFGAGVHFCLGAPLARLEARIALDAILARCPALAVADPDPEDVTSQIVFGFKHLPVRFERAG
jgi:cytochrome P450